MNTKPIPNLGVEIEDFCEYDVNSIIKNFWLCSVTHRMNEFKFSNAFKSLKPYIYNKLAEHGLIDFEAFKEVDFSDVRDSDLIGFTAQTNYISIDVSEIREVIQQYRYERFRDEFEGVGSFVDLQDLLDDIDNHYGHTQQWKIELFDSIIHAEHETGMIFDDVNIDDLREEAEEEIVELLNL